LTVIFDMVDHLWGKGGQKQCLIQICFFHQV